MDDDTALGLYEQINNIDEDIRRILRRRLPHARMARGKADKRGDLLAVDKWNREIERLRTDVLPGLVKQQNEFRERLSAAGYVPR